MDKIIIKNLKTEGILGIHQREQEIPQPIQINVVMSVDTSKAAAEMISTRQSITQPCQADHPDGSVHPLLHGRGLDLSFG